MPSAQDIKQLQLLETEINDAKHQLKALLRNEKRPLHVVAEEKYGKKMELEPMLVCPIGVTYFTRFLESEMNAENLYCLYEVLSLNDFVGQLQNAEENAVLTGEVVKKTHKLLKTYVASGAPQEVNLPGKTKLAIVQVFADAQAKLETKGKVAYIESVQIALLQLKDELLTNLQDPFARYLKSEVFFELAAMFMLNRLSTLQARERLMNANNGGDVLNSLIKYNLIPRHPLTVAESLLNDLIHVLTHYPKIWTSSLEIKYDFLRTNHICGWSAFREKVAELSVVDLSLLQTDAEKFAFFTNVHNLMLIHAALEYDGIPACSYNRVQFLRKIKYNIGGLDFSLDQIAFGILRNNQRHMLFGKRFAAHEKQKLALTPKLSPSHIAFGLINLTKFSPALHVYSPVNFAEQLDTAFMDYLKKHVRHEESVMYLPDYLKENSREFAGHTQTQLLTMVQLRLNYESFSKAVFETNDNIVDFTSILTAEQYKVIRQSVPWEAEKKKVSKKNKLKAFVNKAYGFAKKVFGVPAQAASVVA